MARQRLGQHFLIDRRAIDRIVATALEWPGAPVVEIGPGRGALSQPLIARTGRIAAVELDERLAGELEARFGTERLALLRGNVLDIPLRDAAAALGRAGERLAVVGNLPYLVSKPVCTKLVAEHADVACAVLMFQRDVAERLLAAPGSRDSAPLGILVGAVYEVSRVLDLGPAAFRPPPRVHSTVTLWRPRPDPPAAERLRRLRVCLGACFRARRKTLHNNLRAAVGADAAASMLERCALDGSLRPERIDLDGYLSLADAWPAG